MTFKYFMGVFLIWITKKENGKVIRCKRNDAIIYILDNVLKLDPHDFKIWIKRYF